MTYIFGETKIPYFAHSVHAYVACVATFFISPIPVTFNGISFFLSRDVRNAFSVMNDASDPWSINAHMAIFPLDFDETATIAVAKIGFFAPFNALVFAPTLVPWLVCFDFCCAADFSKRKNVLCLLLQFLHVALLEQLSLECPAA